MTEPAGEDDVRYLLCIKCGYDLRASAGPACPECGWEFGDHENLKTKVRAVMLRRTAMHDPPMFAIPAFNGLLWLVAIVANGTLLAGAPGQGWALWAFLVADVAVLLWPAHDTARRQAIYWAITSEKRRDPRDPVLTTLFTLGVMCWYAALSLPTLASLLHL